jgi:hypothetical protein
VSINSASSGPGETFRHRQGLAWFNAANRSGIAKDPSIGIGGGTLADETLPGASDRVAERVLGVTLTSSMLAAER